jgi:hypothetical protein
MEFACRRYAGDAGLSRRTDGTPKRVGAGVQGRCPCLLSHRPAGTGTDLASS